eukprot:CAMPEP_0194132802 /NCGR_PEP_ID=MMETSP0152-20130528/3185_1 /TAXON_ID=1049557 /ORGANISM="Thalassiothrix antarctica, Strain L6-D1" /LENGTH=578 /DNA_ID=CAMNT_0038827973 /DNA_START=178 /DNA_END=1911 /DNA_ORIENTATION=-
MVGANNNNNNNEVDWEAAEGAVHNIEAIHNPKDDNGNNIVEEEEEFQIPRNEDGSLDGGVAVEPESSKVTAAECDLMLFLECAEAIVGYENHPVLTLGVTVCIGMDKSTKLGAVFQRFVDFVNEYSSSPLRLDHFEFIHCTVLKNKDTAEAAALMKNDRIKVQRIRKDERELKKHAKQIQREADRNYFEHFRNLLSLDSSLSPCDVILDCRGKLVDVDGLNQEVLRTTLRGHSAILCKRSKWLQNLIQEARDALDRKSVVVPDILNNYDDNSKNKSMSNNSDDGDDGIVKALLYPARHAPGFEGVVQIEDDDDENADNLPSVAESRAGSPVLSSPSSNTMLWVTIPNHPPQAVKLLLEYCLTNSVLSLGLEAFQTSWKSGEDDNNDENTTPSYSRRWPEGRKLPFASFAAALAGISLAEEAGIPRLSLMCEVAASRLVECSNVVEALSICTKQEQLSGNPLKRLRTAAMKYVLKRKGIDTLLRTQSFSRALKEPLRSAVLVPSLFQGLGEATGKELRDINNGKLRALAIKTQEKFKEIDHEDSFKREMERQKHRPQSNDHHSMVLTAEENENCSDMNW